MTTLIPKMIMAYGVANGGYVTFKLMRKIQTLQQALASSETSPVHEKQLLDVLARHHREKVKPMLMYWSVLAVVNVYDCYLEMLVSWFPFYFLTKTVFMVWLVVPQTKGGVVAFEQFVSPLFQRFQAYLHNHLQPALRKLVLGQARAVQDASMETSLKAVSAQELQNIHTDMEALLMQLKREKDKRQEQEDGSAMSRTTSADFRRRVVDGEDIDYVSDDDEWSELAYERTKSGKFKLQTHGADDEE